MMNDPRMSRAHAEAGEREWVRGIFREEDVRAALDRPTVDPTHDPGVVLGGPLPEGATRVGRR